VLVRPEGVLLAVIYGLNLLFSHPRKINDVLFQGTAFAAMFLIIISPWIAFNLTFAHRPFPNTITAKFMHYGYPWSPWRSLDYLWNVFLYFLEGSFLFLFPGACFKLFRSIRTKDTLYLQPLFWFLGIIGIYAVALPFIYDEGRYLMPLIPLVIIYGVEGFGQFLEVSLRTYFARSTGWILLLGSVLILWIMGSAVYANRIQLYGLVHMQAARWINDHVPQDAIIATHDIGIIGYFTERQMVDLAGLVTPEIVPIMHDPQKLADYLRTKHVSYLILYTAYYRELLTILNAQLIPSPGAEQWSATGVGPFEIYKVNVPQH
jgi:hypothetical protein